MHPKNREKNVEVVHKKLPKRDQKLVKDTKFRPGQRWREERRRVEIRKHIMNETRKSVSRPLF